MIKQEKLSFALILAIVFYILYLIRKLYSIHKCNTLILNIDILQTLVFILFILSAKRSFFLNLKLRKTLISHHFC